MKKSGNKWVLALAVVLMLIRTWLDGDFSSLSSLSAADYLPVLAITAVIFLFKTGVLSGILLMAKKLLEKSRK